MKGGDLSMPAAARPATTPTDRKARAVDNAALVAAYLDGATLVEVGRRFGLSDEWVRTLLKRAGVPMRPAARRLRFDHAAIVEAYVEGSQTSSIAAVFGLTPHGVRDIVRKHGDVPRRPPRTRPDRPAIVAAYQRGATLPEVGRQFGIGASAVRGLLQRAGVARRPRGAYQRLSAAHDRRGGRDDG